MQKCEIYDDPNSFRFNEGDQFSIRYLSDKTYLPELSGLTLHHFVHIIHKDKHTNKSCFVTFGLKSHQLVNPKRFGANYGTSYSGTVVQSPDFAALMCSARVNKCMDKYDDTGRCKKECIGVKGIMQVQGKYTSLGKVAQGEFGFKYQGKLNAIQTNILNFFLEHATLRESRSGTRWREYIMPYTFSFLADVCPVINWGEQEYFNCQKFAFLFNTNPSDIWKILTGESAPAVQESPVPEPELPIPVKPELPVPVKSELPVPVQPEPDVTTFGPYKPRKQQDENYFDELNFVLIMYFGYFNNLVNNWPQLPIGPTEVFEVSLCGISVVTKILSTNEFLSQAKESDLSFLAAAILFAALGTYMGTTSRLTEKKFYEMAVVNGQVTKKRYAHTWEDLIPLMQNLCPHVILDPEMEAYKTYVEQLKKNNIPYEEIEEKSLFALRKLINDNIVEHAIAISKDLQNDNIGRLMMDTYNNANNNENAQLQKEFQISERMKKYRTRQFKRDESRRLWQQERKNVAQANKWIV